MQGIDLCSPLLMSMNGEFDKHFSISTNDLGLDQTHGKYSPGS
jgi:hypothetical protein